jgi:galactoside O-acetyltransferase
MNIGDIPNVKTFEYTKIIGVENIEFGKHVIIDDFVFIYATNKIKLGNNTHIASFVSITGGGILIMDDFSGIASGSRIITGTDDFTDWGFGGPSIDKKYRNVKTGVIHIGKFCIVGANSVILPNVHIGEGAMVGAGSVVTKDLDPWGVYVGNKRIRERNKADVLKNYERYLLENTTPS